MTDMIHSFYLWLDLICTWFPYSLRTVPAQFLRICIPLTARADFSLTYIFAAPPWLLEHDFGSHQPPLGGARSPT